MTAIPSMPNRRGLVLGAASLVGLTLGGVFIAANAQSPAAPLVPGITISATVPADIPGGAQNADIATAAAFAWQEFIALNWPALTKYRDKYRDLPSRDMPDTSLPFGQNATAGGPPLVWQTFRHKVEIFPPRAKANGVIPPP